MPVSWGGFGCQWGGSPMAVPFFVSGFCKINLLIPGPSCLVSNGDPYVEGNPLVTHWVVVVMWLL